MPQGAARLGLMHDHRPGTRRTPRHGWQQPRLLAQSVAADARWHVAGAWGVNARFRPGDAVRVAAERPAISAGRPHIRTPHYVRGRSGVVAEVMGPFRNPEGLATGGDGLPMQVLYRIRFSQPQLWPDYAGPGDDTLEVEIYEHWLEPHDA